jgi:hypothetical protein
MSGSKFEKASMSQWSLQKPTNDKKHPDFMVVPSLSMPIENGQF